MYGAVLRVQASVSETELAALLWDGLNAEVIVINPVLMTSMARSDVKETVRRQLLNRGLRSVECGPQCSDTYTETMRQSCLAAVRRAFGIERS